MKLHFRTLQEDNFKQCMTPQNTVVGFYTTLIFLHLFHGFNLQSRHPLAAETTNYEGASIRNRLVMSC